MIAAAEEIQAEVIGGGLAGSEAAWQLGRRGVKVRLVEMRPVQMTPAHHTDDLAELVCSNSMKSTRLPAAPALLKAELAQLGSMILATARATSLPAGIALAVDREMFSRRVTEAVASQENIELVRDERDDVIGGLPTIIATGPLTSARMERRIARLVGADSLYFYDAAAPLVETMSIDMSRAFRASRYGKGDADYINCPLDEKAYAAFHEALVAGERAVAKAFEQRELFSACQPVEEIALRSADALRYGPMKPVGLTDPTTGRRPFAVVQLRRDNRSGTTHNMVGFQTNLKWPEQDRIFRMIPGLEHAEFVRYGVMHRNTFIDSPRALKPTLALRAKPNIWFAGQITGSEGYLEAAATGLLAALNVYAALGELEPVILPSTSGIGSLAAYMAGHCGGTFQPQHVNLGLLPELNVKVKGKQARHEALAKRALEDLLAYVTSRPDLAIGRLDGAGRAVPNPTGS